MRIQVNDESSNQITDGFTVVVSFLDLFTSIVASAFVERVKIRSLLTILPKTATRIFTGTIQYYNAQMSTHN